MKNLQIVLGLLLAAGAATAQEYNISTVAGIGHVQGYFGDTGPATNAQLDYPLRLAVDSKGNFYIADYLSFVIRAVTASTGVINTIVGTSNPGFQGDGGAGTQALISDVHGVAIDSNGNLYIADTNNARIRKLNSAGIISTLAGKSDINSNTVHGYTGDGGPATSAALSQPSGVAVDSSGNVYIADYGNYTVRKVVSGGTISTIAGTGAPGYTGDGGPANKAALAQPYALAVDAAGNIYISDLGNNNIRQVTTDGNIHTIVSNVSADSIAVDGAGSIYFSDALSNTVVKILSNGTQFTIAGIPGTSGFSGDGGVGTSAQLNQPHGVAVDSAGNVYVADSGNQVIRLLSPLASSISVVNAAGGNGVSITPGEIVTIFGSGLGPATPVLAQPANGRFGTQLAGTTVSFNGTNGVVIYTSATQVSAIVPYSTPIGAAASVAVSYQGQTFSTASAIPIANAVPGVFTANATGIGQAAVVNQDNSLNGPTSPALAGSIISLYVTGEGQTTPAGVDGKLATAPLLPKPVLAVTVTMAGQQAAVTYAGGAPGLVAGVMQVNAQIPANLLYPFTGPVAVPVVVYVGVTGSQANTTITVAQ